MFLLLEYRGRLSLSSLIVVIVIISVEDLRIGWLVLVVLVRESVVLVSLDNFRGCASGRDHVFMAAVAILNAVVVVDRLISTNDESVGDVTGLLVAVGSVFSQVETINLTLSLTIYIIFVRIEIVGIEIRFGGVIVTAVVVVDLKFVKICIVIGEIVGRSF